MKLILSIIICFVSFTTDAITFSYGRYTGDDAATQAITGLGFQPDLLIVKADGAYQGWMVHKDMSAGNCKGLVGTTALSTGRISTLDADGFTVGTNDDANKDGIIYYFIAFDASADFVLGSFVGTGAETISGLSFQPDMVWLMGAASGDNASPVLRSDLHNNGTVAWDGPDASWDHIASFTSDGFTTNWRTNGSDTYYWVAIDEGASSFETNEYTGNTSDDREITAPGFQPDLSIIITNGGSAPQFRLGNMGIDESMGFVASGLASNGIQKTTTNGFEIGTDSKVNNNGTVSTWLAFGGGTNVLPVELTTFNAKPVALDLVEINWETASEINSSSFEIERGKDGMNFEIIDNVPAAGTSSEIITYKSFDYDPSKGINYYRLKAIDIDGSFEYSAIKTVYLQSNNLSNITGFPNPAVDQINVSFQSEEGTIYFLQITDASGVVMYQANLMSFEGLNQIDFNISTYKKGLYFIKLSEDNQETFKAVKFIKN